MKILAIETSCDETAVCLLETAGAKNPKFKILANSLFSQAKLHEEFGGVFPNLARREHQKNLTPLFLKAMSQYFSKVKTKKEIGTKNKIEKIKKILERESELLKDFEEHIVNLPKPKLDRIAVTVGPGLEPALWVGINFAKALGTLWDIPVVPVNHMKGHFLAPLAEGHKISFPALGLLISGGHTELVLAKSPTSYKIIGQTLDDACGEAYDKVARILGLPYPGGPEIAKLAERFRNSTTKIKDPKIKLPRPMIHTKDFNFSFSGLKTAVLYLVRDFKNSNVEIQDYVQSEIAYEFEESVKDVLILKTKKALEQNKVKSLVIGGGVSANDYIKTNLEKLAKDSSVQFVTSSKQLATDNAIMIGIAGFFTKTKPISKINAEGNLSI